jgi:hypothetical protein
MALKWKWDKNCMGLISHSFSKSGATQNSGETLVFWSSANSRYIEKRRDEINIS